MGAHDGHPRNTRKRSWLFMRLGALVMLAVLASGCGNLGSSQDKAASVAATDFYGALARSAAEACDALAPGTRQELESTFGPCPTSLSARALPVATRVRHVDVYGKDAMVVLDHDVAFLALYADGWKITAAGCRPKPDRPFTCTLTAG